MNDIGGFSEGDFCILFLIFGGMGILVSGLLLLIQERLARRDRRVITQSVIGPVPAAVPNHVSKVFMR
jgi:hypothetical protein